MATLVIEGEETGLLRELLETCLSDLRMEIADTDRQDFRDRLKRRKAVLEKVIAQL